MTRVAVVGNGGSGKTWLALRLAAALQVPAIHLVLPDLGLVRYVASYRRRMRPRMVATLSTATCPVVRLRSRRRVRAWAEQVVALGRIPG